MTHESFLRHSSELLEKQCYLSKIEFISDLRNSAVCGGRGTPHLRVFTCWTRRGVGKERTQQAPFSQVTMRKINFFFFFFATNNTSKYTTLSLSSIRVSLDFRKELTSEGDVVKPTSLQSFRVEPCQAQKS